MQSDVKITQSIGQGKGGKMSWFIRPIYYCFNRSHKVSGFTGKELQEKADKVISKWYYPRVILYEVDGETIASNSKENALTEYWRVCAKEKIGVIFEATRKQQ